ncbi:MAG: hypothetical protein WA709_28685 [Stellaceae bacterium]
MDDRCGGAARLSGRPRHGAQPALPAAGDHDRLADAQHNPIPLLVFQLIGNVFSPAIAAMSTLMILFAMAVVIALERVGGLRRAMAM